MRVIIALLLIALTIDASHLSAQNNHADEVVNAILNRGVHGKFSSWDEKELEKLGDAAAVSLTKRLSGKVPSNAEISQIALIIRLSFEFPNAISAEADRKPRAALLVLKRLENLQIPPDIRKEVDDTEKAISSPSN